MDNTKTRAKRVAEYFMKGDDYIDKHNHKFDSLWEQGDGDMVAYYFKQLYNDSAILQRCCSLSSFFGKGMIGL